MTQPPNSDVEKVAYVLDVKFGQQLGHHGKDFWRPIARAAIAALQPSGGDAVAAEREACLAIANAYLMSPIGSEIARQIRARTPTPQEK